MYSHNSSIYLNGKDSLRAANQEGMMFCQKLRKVFCGIAYAEFMCVQTTYTCDGGTESCEHLGGYGNGLPKFVLYFQMSFTTTKVFCTSFANAVAS